MARILLFSFFLSFWFSGFAQAPVKDGIIVSGVVKDSPGGEPLEKASVSLKGPKRFTVLTDAKGAFAITGVPAGNYSLAIAFVGHTPLRQPVLVVEKGKGRIVIVDRVAGIISVGQIGNNAV